jgi:uncharacterized protein YwgA
MFEEYLPICYAVHKLNEMQGRKRFQKIVYLSKEAGIPFSEMFEWNNYGPFSKGLAQEIDNLCKMDFLIEKPIEHSDGSKEYRYKLSEKGKDFLTKEVSKNLELYKRFDSILSILDKYETNDLEKLASIRFLDKRGYDLDYIAIFLEYTKSYKANEVKKGKKLTEELFKKLQNA